MEISLAQPADIPALCDLLSELFSQEAEFIPDRAAQERGLAAILAHPEAGHILVARRDGRALGMVSLQYLTSTALGGRVALLEDMVVTARVRGGGLGARLLSQAVALARNQGCLRVTLLTDGDNAAAQRFYARHGFKPSPMTPLRLAMPDQA
ncbi:MAG: GNAT family N-acetyltransferase [Pseudomonadota bacterium]